MPLPVNVIQFADAVKRISEKSTLGSRLKSSEWARVPLAIRETAFFSARVENARLLSEMQMGVRNALAGIKTEGGAGWDAGRFISEMRKLADRLGLGDPDSREITNIQGPPRLRLIYETQADQARGFAKFKMDNDPAVLNEWPAQRLVRMLPRRQPRDWPTRWREAKAKVGGVGVARSGFVALKTSPIWAALSAFGTPWPPYDFNSGMRVEDVSRREAVSLGLIAADATLKPMQMAEYDKNVEASVRGMTPDAVRMLKRAGLSIKGDKVTR